MQTWLTDAIQLQARGDATPALRSIALGVHAHVRAHEFAAIDQTLAVADPLGLDPALVLCLAQTTFASKDRLPSRPLFVAKARTALCLRQCGARSVVCQGMPAYCAARRQLDGLD